MVDELHKDELKREQYIKRILKKSNTIFLIEVTIMSIGLLSLKLLKWLYSIIDKLFKWIGQKIKNKSK